MRIRTATVVLGTAAALSVLAVPAASADTAKAATIGKVVVNGGKPIVLGTGNQTFTATLTASDDSGIALAGVAFLHNAAGDELDSADADPVCKAVNSTTSTCTVTFKVNAKSNIGDNAAGGTWYAYGVVIPKDADLNTGKGVVTKDKVATTKVLRATRLTVNAAPEPVKKGATLTVTGSLTRADWKTAKYAAFAGQKATLQFRKAGTTNFVNVKTVTTSSTGALKTTVKAAADGYWRYVYTGNTTTVAVSAAADYVDVK
ncbi:MULTISPECIES: calcium-binding protein [unclassified Streptomyces]|uniref:calcium-binding protein n=1 Tax=unclassified Streptomyces TaxID=2593676 RepID=UPI0038203C8F